MTSDPSTWGLLSRYLRGDQAAFTALHDRYAASLRQFARKWGGPRVMAQCDVDDVVQETFIRLLSRAPDVERRRGTFRGFLFDIARCHMIDVARRHRDGHPRAALRQADRAPAEAGAPEPQPAETTAPREAVLARERDDLVRAALEELPDDDYRILVARTQLGWDCRRIAEELDISHDAARQRAVRCLRRLAVRLRRTAGDDTWRSWAQLRRHPAT